MADEDADIDDAKDDEKEQELDADPPEDSGTANPQKQASGFRREIRKLKSKISQIKRDNRSTNASVELSFDSVGGGEAQEFLGLVQSVNATMSELPLAIEIAEAIYAPKTPPSLEAFHIPEIQGMSAGLDKLTTDLQYWLNVANSEGMAAKKSPSQIAEEVEEARRQTAEIEAAKNQAGMNKAGMNTVGMIQAGKNKTGGFEAPLIFTFKEHPNNKGSFSLFHNDVNEQKRQPDRPKREGKAKRQKGKGKAAAEIESTIRQLVGALCQQWKCDEATAKKELAKSLWGSNSASSSASPPRAATTRARARGKQNRQAKRESKTKTKRQQREVDCDITISNVRSVKSPQRASSVRILAKAPLNVDTDDSFDLNTPKRIQSRHSGQHQREEKNDSDKKGFVCMLLQDTEMSSQPGTPASLGQLPATTVIEIKSVQNVDGAQWAKVTHPNRCWIPCYDSFKNPNLPFSLTPENVNSFVSVFTPSP